MLKNKVHAILSKNGLRPSFSDIFGNSDLKSLKEVELRPNYRQVLNGYLKIVETLTQIISEVTKTIQWLVKKDPCSYGGLVPSVHSSGGKTTMGSINERKV